jgi:replicative DNA helicase
LYLALLKALLNWELFNKYGDDLDYQWIKENQPEVFRLFQTVRYLHEQVSNKTYSVADVEIAFATLYPQSKATDFAPLFLQLRTLEVDTTNVESYLNTVRERSQATKLAKIALGVAEGTQTAEDLQSFLVQQADVETNTPTNDFVETDIRIIHAKRLLQPGLRWRLDSLNKTLGSIRKGNFGFIVARPETGKTTFLASEVTNMARQVTDPIIWFNNEEEHEAVIYRLYQAAFGIDYATLLSRLDYYAEAYARDIGKRIELVTDTPTTRKLVERICSQHHPSLVIFDQIDKIQGFADDRNDLELKAIYGWAREIAKAHAPVIGVCQAGGTGEGKRWLTMNDVDNSKTGKQGEADWILGIGKVPDAGLETYRYLHLSKNKLQGDSDTVAGRRHDQWEVRINPDIARYSDITGT